MIKKITEITAANVSGGEEKIIENIKSLSVTTDESGNLQAVEAIAQTTTTNILKTRHDNQVK